MSEKTTAVENTDVAAAAPHTEVDYEAKLKEKDAEIAKISEEKENYKKGLLKAKGKMPEEIETPEGDLPIDELVAQKVQEALLNTKEAQLQKEKDEILQTVLKRNKELEVALKNRGQVVSTAGGSNQEKPEVKTEFFTPEQLEAIKKKGLDPEKVKANLLKSTQVS